MKTTFVNTKYFVFIIKKEVLIIYHEKNTKKLDKCWNYIIILTTWWSAGIVLKPKISTVYSKFA